MSLQAAKDHLAQFGAEERIQEFPTSSATVDLAAEALGCAPCRIAKTLSFSLPDRVLLIVAAGDVRIDNAKFRTVFHTKARMLPAAEVERTIGHAVGGVCPFGINPGISVYLDESLLNEIISRVPLGRYDHNDTISLFIGIGHPARHVEHALRIRHRAPTKLLDNRTHLRSPTLQFYSWIQDSESPRSSCGKRPHSHSIRRKQIRPPPGSEP